MEGDLAYPVLSVFFFHGIIWMERDFSIIKGDVT